jgi:hypothetical protein
MKYAGTQMKRFFSPDSQVYQDGALPAKTKDLLVLVASLVSKEQRFNEQYERTV